MIIAGLELARRLEAAEAANGVQCAMVHERLNPGMGTAVLEVGGGYAIFVGNQSPLTHAVAMGMQGPVSVAEVVRMENFYDARGAAVMVELCPMADASLVELLAVRGYRTTEFNNVLARRLPGAEFRAAEMVRAAGENEEALWAHTVGSGFLEKDELTSDEMDVGRAIWHIEGVRCYLALEGERAAGAAAMTIHANLALLFADSTMVGFRGAGRQAALIRERLRVASEEGCEWATASTLPGSVSQRNYERAGFQVVYTKAVLGKG